MLYAGIGEFTEETLKEIEGSLGKDGESKHQDDEMWHRQTKEEPFPGTGAS